MAEGKRKSDIGSILEEGISGKYLSGRNLYE